MDNDYYYLEHRDLHTLLGLLGESGTSLCFRRTVVANMMVSRHYYCNNFFDLASMAELSAAGAAADNDDDDDHWSPAVGNDGKFQRKNS